MTTVEELIDDLRAEHEALDTVVTDLPPEAWETPTPSPGWAVRDQIGHLWYFDGTATMAIADPAAFTESLTALLATMADGDMDEATLGEARTLDAAALLAAWRSGRRALLDAAGAADPTVRVPWYGPDMSMKSFLTARLMETWAHGQDVVDAVGADRPATDRLRHIAQLGFITRGWTYVNRGLEAPSAPVRVELDAPGGDTWTFGPDDAAETVRGPAEDFCLVVTQRRNITDTALAVDGVAAAEWLSMAQAFAGGPTDPPAAAAAGEAAS